MKQTLKNIFFRIAALLPSDMTGRASILMYHSVSDNGDFFSVTPVEFRKQMEYLHASKREVTTLPELVARQKSGALKGGEVAVTFDDGYRDNLTHAFPVLRELDIPATIFVTTGSVGGKGKHGGNMLSTDELKTLHASGIIDIEPHSVTHPKLSKLDEENARTEIYESKQYLEKLLEKRCDYFAYPYGNLKDETAVIVRELGFIAAVTVREGSIDAETDVFRLQRNSIDCLTSWTQFLGKISRTIDRYHSFKRS